MNPGQERWVVHAFDGEESGAQSQPGLPETLSQERDSGVEPAFSIYLAQENSKWDV